METDSELIFQNGSERTFQQSFQPQDRPAAPRLPSLIPLGRLRLKLVSLGLRPKIRLAVIVVVNRIAPLCPRNTVAHAVTARGIRQRKGEALEGVSLGCPLSRRGQSQTGHYSLLPAARGGIFFLLAAVGCFPWGLRRGGGRGVYIMSLEATWGTGGRRCAPLRPPPRNRLGVTTGHRPGRQRAFPYAGKRPTGGVSRCARRLSPNTGRARSIR